jgi:hypothetical protein
MALLAIAGGHVKVRLAQVMAVASPPLHAAAGEHAGAARSGALNEASDPLALHARDQRAHLGVVVEGLAHLDGAQRLHQRLHQLGWMFAGGTF